MKLLIVFISFINFSFAQKNIDPKNMIGFSCYSGGMQTKQEHDFTALLEKSNYKAFPKYLNSKNTAEKFLAAKVCERLYKKKKLITSKIDLQKIQTIFNSKEVVSVCSGCTSFYKIPLNELSKKNDKNAMLERIEMWLDKYLK